MLEINRKKLILFFALCSLLFIIPIAVYMSRSPVLIVTDASFYQLYGSQRIKQQRQKTSRQLFRRFIPVYVAESAGPDLVAIAAGEAFDRPHAVIFPHRYQEGAAIYSENHPEVQVFVFGGLRSEDNEPFIRVRTDTVLDLYRAGLGAALLAEDKGVLFISEGSLADEYREAFQAGLRDGGFLDDPVYIGLFTYYMAYDLKGCVVAAGPASYYFEASYNIPTILFSWANPGLSPNIVKLIFNDSSWALAARALKTRLPAQGDMFLGSEPMVLKDRMDRRTYRMLNRFTRANFQAN